MGNRMMCATSKNNRWRKVAQGGAKPAHAPLRHRGYISKDIYTPRMALVARIMRGGAELAQTMVGQT